jgi:hypothetical protein
VAKHRYTFEKQKINLFNNIFQDICLVITVKCTYQKSSASESASATDALSHSRLSCFSVSPFDFRRHFFEGPGSSSTNSTSRVASSASPTPSDTVKCRPWSPSLSS